MQLHFSSVAFLTALLTLTNTAQALSPANAGHIDKRQIAAGGGAVAGTTAATQAATVSVAASHVVVGGVTTVTYVAFTQTFATTALGTWAFGSETSSGTIGLGTISGTVGSVKSKRAAPTPEAAS